MHQILSCNKNMGSINTEKYSELITSFLIADKKNELLMKNHELHPIGSQLFLEANANIYINSGRNREGNKGYGYYHCGGHKHIRL